MELKIIHESGARGGSEQVFNGRELIRLGRHPDNDCVFDGEADRVVSAFHAEIRLIDGRAFISDLDSTNGMLINGQWAEATLLTSGDLIELGKSGPSFRVVYKTDVSAPRLDPTLNPQDWLAQPLSSSEPSDRNRDSKFPATTRTRFKSFPVSRANTVHSHSAPPEVEQSDNGKKKYGERTMGMMIQSALAQAGLVRREGTTKSTDYFKALVDEKVTTSSSRLKKALLIVVVLIIIAGAGIGYYVYRNRSVQVYQTTQVNYGDAAGGSIAATNRYAVFMLAGQVRSPSGQPGEIEGFCTAFAVARDILATNAHCIQVAQTKYMHPIAIMNGAPANRYEVIRILAHPSYQAGRISPDVGVLRIRGQLSNLVTIAPANELGIIAPGVPMFLYGFPGRLNKVDAPEATFIKGDIGRITTFSQRLGNFGENTLLQHSAFSSGGTSGSPIFNTSGNVIGINAGGYTEDGKPLSGYNFAMRIDLINTLLPSLAAN